MPANRALATKLPADVIMALDDVCNRFGLRKNAVIEQALREKIEDLIDAHELEAARKTAVAFVPWSDVERRSKGRAKR